MRLATRSWIEKRQRVVDTVRASREEDPESDTMLLIPASQHPLIGGKFPGPEFEKRLLEAAERYEQIVDSGGKAEFFLTASRHHDPKSGQTDRVALYDAAGRWLMDNGIPARALHGKDWIDTYQPGGVYNGAGEVAVSAAGFLANQRFRQAQYICSPGQAERARIYSLAYGIPLDVEVPDSLEDVHDQFHAPSAKTIVFNGLMRSIDPYGTGLLKALTLDRVPDDGNTGTVPELLPEYSHLPWYQ